MLMEAGSNMKANAASQRPPEPMLTDHLFSRISAIATRLGDASADLDMLNTRLFGPIPTDARTAHHAEGICTAETLLQRLDAVLGQVEDTASLARALNARI